MGRRRRSAAEWQHLVEQWLAGGQTREQFAHAQGLNPATLGWWRWKLRQREQLPKVLAVDLIDLALCNDNYSCRSRDNYSCRSVRQG